MQLIGIDIGTTSICGVVIDSDSGAVLRSRTVGSDAFIPGSAPWEKLQSPEKIMGIALQILEAFVCEETAAIGVTGQMHGIVYVDEKGKAVSPLYTWQDGRGDQPYKGTTYAKFLGSCTGYGNVTDFYNRENGIRPQKAVCYCTIQDYLVMQLCGLEKPLLHSSNAASLGLYDLEKNIFRYPVDAEVVTDYRVAGTYKGIPVSVAIGDNQASVFSCLAEEKQVLLNVGTGSQVSVVSACIREGENIEVRPYFEGKYLIVGSALCGGRAYSMLKDFYGDVLGYAGQPAPEQIYAIMDKMLESASEETLRVDTRFAGTRKDPTVTGGIYDISVSKFTPAALTRGVLAGMARELWDLYGQMDVQCCGMVGSGNGVRKNRHFIDLAQKQFGMRMRIPAHVEEAAFGAALFGAISAGIYENAAQARKCIRFV